MQLGSVANSRASSVGGKGATGASTPTQNIDIYRPLANQVTVSSSLFMALYRAYRKKPLQSLLPTTKPPTITSLLQLRQSAYTTRIQNKALNFSSSIQTSSNLDEAKAVRGKKRNRGDAASLEVARREAEGKEKERRKLEVGGRGKRKRAVLDAGQEIEYVPLFPSFDTSAVVGRLMAVMRESNHYITYIRSISPIY